MKYQLNNGNPINPILSIPKVRDLFLSFGGLRIAVSPIINNYAIRGPLAKMMSELGYKSSSLAVAEMYRNLCDVFVIDKTDESYTKAIEELGIKVICTNTIMDSLDDKIQLAEEIMRYANCVKK